MNMTGINDFIKVAGEVEAESRYVAMMNDAPFECGADDRYHMVAKMAVKMFPNGASIFNSVKDIEEAMKVIESSTFAGIV